MKKYQKLLLGMMVLMLCLLPAVGLAKVDCPNDPCHPYDPCDPCYMASACTTCYGCSLCCPHENIPYKEFDCSLCTYPCETDQETQVTIPAPVPETTTEMPKTGAPSFSGISALLMTLGCALLPKR